MNVVYVGGDVLLCDKALSTQVASKFCVEMTLRLVLQQSIFGRKTVVAGSTLESTLKKFVRKVIHDLLVPNLLNPLSRNFLIFAPSIDVRLWLLRFISEDSVVVLLMPDEN